MDGGVRGHGGQLAGGRQWVAAVAARVMQGAAVGTDSRDLNDAISLLIPKKGNSIPFWGTFNDFVEALSTPSCNFLIKPR